MMRLLAPTLAILLAGLTVIFIGGILVMVVRDLNDGHVGLHSRLVQQAVAEVTVSRGPPSCWGRARHSTGRPSPPATVPAASSSARLPSQHQRVTA
jgi:hypothetical protein